MEELLNIIEASHGYPAFMVERSARARAAADGVDVEAVLRAWAGQGDVPVASPAPSAPAAEAAAQPAAAAAPAEPPAEAGPQVQVLEPATPVPDSPEDDAPTAEAEVEEEPARAGSLPMWLVAAFLFIPAIAVTYAAFVPNGPDCGGAGQLALDPVTGEAVACDGSEYGVDAVNFFATGEALYASNCASCHGAGGGGGTGPGFTGGALLATFPAGTCIEHVEWVAIGTNAWPEPTYGANATPVGGSGAVMPGFSTQLSPDEIAAVVLYERVQFGGEAVDVSEADCGLASEVAAAP